MRDTARVPVLSVRAEGLTRRSLRASRRCGGWDWAAVAPRPVPLVCGPGAVRTCA